MSRQMATLGFPAPGPVVRAALIGVFAIWLVLAVSINWLESDALKAVAKLMVGHSAGVMEGEAWRFITAPLIHGWMDTWHVVSTMLGIYFLGTSLEEAWGSQRFARFLAASAIVPYVFQFVTLLVLPNSIASKLVPGGMFSGAMPVVEAIAVAWSLSFKDRQVLLFFVLPINGRALLAIVIGSSLLYVLAVQRLYSGLLAPFFGMGVGYLLGASTPSPLRRWYLKMKLARLDAEVNRTKAKRKQAALRSGLRVIDGGRDDSRGPDGGYLN